MDIPEASQEAGSKGSETMDNKGVTQQDRATAPFSGDGVAGDTNPDNNTGATTDNMALIAKLLANPETAALLQALAKAL